MEAKAALVEMIGEMTDREAERLLDYINNRNDPDELTPEEIAELDEIEAEVAAGDVIGFEEFRAKYGV